MSYDSSQLRTAQLVGALTVLVTVAVVAYILVNFERRDVEVFRWNAALSGGNQQLAQALLEADGHTVSRWAHRGALKELDASTDTTLVFGGLNSLRGDALDHLLAWVDAGGQAIVTLDGAWSGDLEALFDNASNRAGDGTNVRGSQPAIIRRLGLQLVDFDDQLAALFPDEESPRPKEPSFATVGDQHFDAYVNHEFAIEIDVLKWARWMDYEAESIDDLPKEFDLEQALQEARFGPLIPSGGHAGIVQTMHVGWGRGTVIVVNTVIGLEDRNLHEHDHADWLLALPYWAATNTGTPLTDARRELGPQAIALVVTVDAMPLVTMLWRAAPWLWLLGGIVITLMVWRGLVRAGPAVHLQTQSRRSILEHFTAAGQYRWNAESGAMLGAAQQALRQRARTLHPTLAGANDLELAAWLSAVLDKESGSRPDEIVALLSAQPTRGQEFVEHMQKLTRLRQRLGGLSGMSRPSGPGDPGASTAPPVMPTGGNFADSPDPSPSGGSSPTKHHAASSRASPRRGSTQ